jgi:hypothetical protein
VEVPAHKVAVAVLVSGVQDYNPLAYGVVLVMMVEMQLPITWVLAVVQVQPVALIQGTAALARSMISAVSLLIMPVVVVQNILQVGWAEAVVAVIMDQVSTALQIPAVAVQAACILAPVGPVVLVW